MSTLKVTHLQNENGTGPAMSIAVGGGVTFAGISTFYGAIDLQTPTDLRVAAGATISGSTNTITASTNGSERLRITSGGGVLIGGHTSAVDVGNAPNIEIVNTSTSTLTLARNDTSIASGNDIAAIRVWGNDSNGTYQQCAEILAEADGDHGTGDKPTALSFKVSADGASSPTERLRIGSDGASAFTSDSSTRTATFTGNGVEVIHSAGSNIFLGTQTGTDGKIGTENNANLHLYANGYGNRITVNTSGNLSIVDGDLVVANGHGIDFSAHGNASGMTSELLDDYEEGTWTPVIASLTLGNGTLTGHYTKIGNIAHLSFRLDCGSTTSFSGNMNGITGFPFTAALASNTGYLTASNPSNNWFGFTTMYAAAAGTNFIQWDVGSTNNYVGSNSIPFAWGASTYMRFNITYRTT